MDPTRISIARVLALDVPLSWQDAVAIMREVAVLAEMNAAWNDQPSLVSAERCFLTDDGAIDLPDTAERESPDDLRALLDLLLRGRQAPPAVASLGRRHGRADLSGALTAVEVGDRRALIAAVVSRARAAETGPPPAIAAVASPPAEPVRVAIAPPKADTPPAPADVAIDHERAAAASPPPRPVVVPLRSMRATAEVPAFAPALERDAEPDTPRVADEAATALPRVIRPPFVAAPAPEARPPEGRTPEVAVGASEPATRELERLRMKTAAATPPAPPRLTRLLPWVSYRPDGVDPRLIGGAALVLSATIAFVVGSTPTPTTPAPPPSPTAAARAVATTADTTTTTMTAADGTGVGAPTGVAASESGLPVRPPAAQRPSTGTAPIGAPATALVPPAAAPAIARPTRRVEGTAPTPVAATNPATSAPTTPPTGTSSTPVSTWVEGAGRPATRAEGRQRDRDLGGRTAESADASLSRWLPPSRAPLYSVGDSGVTPPVMRRQQLPSMLLEPRTDVPEEWPFLELVVDERGAVEAVRLRAVTVAPGQTLYRHRMLLAAAKAWQFDPATRDGVPVRFLMRVPLEP